MSIIINIANSISDPYHLSNKLNKFILQLKNLNDYSKVKSLIKEWINDYWNIPEGKETVYKFLELDAKISRKELFKKNVTSMELTEWARLKKDVHKAIFSMTKSSGVL